MVGIMPQANTWGLPWSDKQISDKYKVCGQNWKVKNTAKKIGLAELLEKEIENNRLELIDSGDPIEMNEEATAVRKGKNASINVAMDLVRNNKAQAVGSAGNSGARMASAI